MEKWLRDAGTQQTEVNDVLIFIVKKNAYVHSWRGFVYCTWYHSTTTESFTFKQTERSTQDKIDQITTTGLAGYKNVTWKRKKKEKKGFFLHEFSTRNHSNLFLLFTGSTFNHVITLRGFREREKRKKEKKKNRRSKTRRWNQNRRHGNFNSVTDLSQRKQRAW